LIGTTSLSGLDLSTYIITQDIVAIIAYQPLPRAKEIMATNNAALIPVFIWRFRGFMTDNEDLMLFSFLRLL
jgi:hypothetical protein